MQTLDAETAHSTSQTTVVEVQDDETATPQIIITVGIDFLMSIDFLLN
mgnify:CR=1 FL=1